MVFGRIRKQPSKEYVEHILSPRLEEYKSQFIAQILIHRAHVIMLFEQKIIKKHEAAEILKGLLSIEKIGIKALRLKPQSDIYMATESCLIELVGEVGGKLHIGRSRNDLIATSTRIYVREVIVEVIDNLIELMKALLKLSEENVETIMPGYTHWQQAQPVTFAHYLIAHIDAIERSVVRLYSAYKNTNLNPLGAVALAGTGFPIHRLRTAELLSFDGLVENSYDAIASRDFIAETASALAILMCDFSRLIEDFIIFTTSEFSILELSDEYVGTSSIMPQKKNPISLEMIRAKAGHTIGDLTSILIMLKSIPYSNVGDWSEICSAFSDAKNLTIGSIKVMKGLVLTVNVNRDLMRKRTAKGFSTVTELVDYIVREKDMSFRVAHEIVSKLVLMAIHERKTPAEIDSELVDKAANEVLGVPLNLPEYAIRNSLDPMENIRIRHSRGGPAPIEVKRMLSERWKKISKEEDELQNIKMKNDQIRIQLLNVERKIFNS